jgi:hypothetical protein
MEEPAEEVKILIHHILNRYKFYRLEIGQYFEILDLLRQPRSEDARMIQQSVFRGVVAFNNINKYFDIDEEIELELLFKIQLFKTYHSK